MKSLRTTKLHWLVAALLVVSSAGDVTQEGNAQSIRSYLQVGRLGRLLEEGEIKFEYYGGPMPGILPPIPPPPAVYEAIYRGPLAPKNFERLLSCKIRPDPDPPLDADLNRFCGALTITVGPSPYEDKVIPRRSVRIVFFYNLESIWLEGKWWTIDAAFWDWLHDSFPFSGIDIHRMKRDPAHEQKADKGRPSDNSDSLPRQAPDGSHPAKQGSTP